MDPKVLLMPVYSRGNEIERLRGALSLTKIFNAHLKIIHAQSKPSDLIGPELYALSSSVRQQIVSIMDESVRQDQADLRQHFEDLCRDNDVAVSHQSDASRPSASWHEIQGARSALVGLHGRVSDLIIVPHSKSGDATLTFEEAILHTGRAVFLVPRGMWEINLTNAVIGWDGGLECVRAVQQALPFLKRATGVTIAVGHNQPTDRPSAEAASDYLSCHGISADIRTFGGSGTSPGSAIVEIAKELKSDLLVTGAYAHTRLRQRLLGGVTSH